MGFCIFLLTNRKTAAAEGGFGEICAKMTERSGGQAGILSCSIAFLGRGVAVRIGSLRQDLKHRKHNFEDRFSRHLSASILFSCAAANGAVNGIGRGFRPFRDAPSARSGVADAERPRHGTFMLILIIYLYYTEYFILCDVVSCGRHARSDGTFMRLFRTLSSVAECDGSRVA